MLRDGRSSDTCPPDQFSREVWTITQPHEDTTAGPVPECVESTFGVDHRGGPFGTHKLCQRLE